GSPAGVRDPSYFARAFKQFTGCTPSGYRDACQPAARGAVLELEEASRLELLRPPLRSGLPRAG
ncbi:MAG TPA: DNA-binding response regulator, partial [Pseudomonas sp.]|nr:DNA-binding response regulator [Pseudomonas sp.]